PRIGLRVGLPRCRIAWTSRMRIARANRFLPFLVLAVHDLFVQVRTPQAEHQCDRDDERRAQLGIAQSKHANLPSSARTHAANAKRRGTKITWSGALLC